MIELVATLAELSRTYCVGICAFLVPVNLILTGLTLGLLIVQRSRVQVTGSAIASCTFALMLFLHITSWFIIGVITPVTFILGGLGVLCLSVNITAVFGYPWFRQHLPQIKNVLASRYLQRVPMGKV